MFKIRLIDYDSKRDRHRHWYITSVKASPRRLRRIARKVGAGGMIDEKKNLFVWQYGSMPDMYITSKGIYCQKNTKVSQNSAARVASILLANKAATGKRGKWRKGVKKHSSRTIDMTFVNEKRQSSSGGSRRLV